MSVIASVVAKGQPVPEDYAMAWQESVKFLLDLQKADTQER